MVSGQSSRLPEAVRGKRPFRLRGHLVLLVLAVLVPALAFGAAASWEALRSRDAANEMRLVDRAQALSAAIDSHIAGHFAALTVLSASSREDPGDLAALAENTGHAFGSWVVMMERGGQPILNTHPSGGGEARGEELWVEQVFATGRPAVSDLAAAEAAAFVFVPVLRDGTIWRVAGMPLLPSHLSALLAGRAGAGPGTAALTDGRGVVVGHSRDAETLVGKTRPPRPEAAEMGVSGILRARSLVDGSALRTAFHRVEAAPGWTLWVNEPEATFAEARRGPLLALAGGGLLALGIGLTLATGLTRRLLQPVDALVARAEAVTSGRAQPEASLTPAKVAEFERLRQATEAAQQALRDSEERLRLALEAAELGAWEVDLVSGLATRTSRALEIFGFGTEAQSGVYPSWRNRVHPEDRVLLDQAIETVRRGGAERYRVEYRFLRPDGQWRWVESHGRAVERSEMTGEALRLSGTTQDVTARRDAQERQHLLSRELDHRAKNALAVVQAALRLTPRDDPAAFARAIEGRVMALSRAHTLLAQAHWTGAELQSVISGEIEPFLGQPGPRASCDGPALSLSPAAVQALSMAFHELATNAAKYGALATPDGQVTVRWACIEAEPGAGLLHLRWTETGGAPCSGAPVRRGFGTSLIEATVVRQLGGRFSAEWQAEGLLWQAWLPLDRVLASGG